MVGRYVIPVVAGRGAGLANEMLVWGKAFIVAKALNTQLCHPAWGMNKRRYWELFGTSRLDWFAHRGLCAALPYVEFQEGDVSPGEPIIDAVVRFGKERGLERKWPLVVGVKGLWGGMEFLEPARGFMLNQLLAAKGTNEYLFHINRQAKHSRLRIGMHVRRGDFLAIGGGDDNYRGRFNKAVPIRWYQAIVAKIAQAFPGRVQLFIATDGSEDDVASLTREFDYIDNFHIRQSAPGDILALAQSDLLICSISSFSILAAFLGGCRYLWPSFQLTEQDGYLSIWGADSSSTNCTRDYREQLAARRTPNGELASRGIAVDWGGDIPQSLLDDLDRQLALKDAATDLIRYGSVRGA